MNPLAGDLPVLERVAQEHGVPADALVRMIELEASFHRSGRRRGLFPALREILSKAAAAGAERDPD